MASGRLGAADIAATTNTTVYTAPAGYYSVVSVNLCSRADVTAKVRLALAAVDTPTAAEWIEYDTTLSPGGVLERTGLAMSAGQKLVVYSSHADISAVVYGIEEEV